MKNVILSCEDCKAANHNRCESIGKCKKLVLRHLLRILKEPCKKHYEEEFVSHCSDAKERIYPEHKYLCPDCMAEIEKEIEK